jgi:hypothetical protein
VDFPRDLLAFQAAAYGIGFPRSVVLPFGCRWVDRKRGPLDAGSCYRCHGNKSDSRCKQRHK